MIFGKKAKMDPFTMAAGALSKRKLSDAVGWLKEGLKLDPRCVAAWADLGGALTELGDHQDPERCLRNALNIDPNYGAAWFNLGSLYMRNLGKPEQGLKFYQEGIRCDPDDEDAVCFAAEALQRLSRTQEAGDLLATAVKAHSNFKKSAKMQEEMGRVFRQWLDDIAKG